MFQLFLPRFLLNKLTENGMNGASGQNAQQHAERARKYAQGLVMVHVTEERSVTFLVLDLTKNKGIANRKWGKKERNAQVCIYVLCKSLITLADPR